MKDYSKINKEIAKISMLCKYKEGSFIGFVITDDIDAKEYIQKTISSINTNGNLNQKIINYDFLANKDDAIKKYQRLCLEKENIVVATGMGNYAQWLVENGECHDISAFYMGVFNMPRDSFYLENNVKLILLVNQSEMKEFRSPSADDFTSYAILKIDIDEILKEDNMQDMDER